MLQSKAGYIDARPHIRQPDEVLLQRTAGPYIWVKSRRSVVTERCPLYPRKRTNSGHLKMSASCQNVVGWDRGADRASNDADVSSTLPIIPYGGFSPVRLEGWLSKRCLPGSSAA